jgi:glutathionylspermidine amidase/synthetase
MTQPSPQPAEKFGTLLGYAPGDVPAYSSDYDSADDEQLPDRHAYRSYVDGIYMGHKWQCVEFARRWLYVNRGYIFDDVAMAFEIFELSSVRVVADNSRLPLRAFRNGARRRPEPGCLLIWDEGGEFERTGHVAIVTDVSQEWVRFAEQNVGHRTWPEGRDYSRQVKATVTPEGEYWLECSFGDATILGWVIQTDDDLHAEPVADDEPALMNLLGRKVPDRGQGSRAWLNMANGDEAAYVAMMGGHTLAAAEEDRLRFVCVSDTAHESLRDATGHLHSLFLHATDYVLRDDALLEKFNIPRSLWPKIHQSWSNRRNEMITGRFDFSLSERGLKVFEYNCDSASCHMETGKVQGKWSRHFGCRVGRDAGEALHAELRRAWGARHIEGVVHIMQDRDLEETYHALFMQEAMEEAGISTRIIHGVAGLSWDDRGNILDPHGQRIHTVWKTWAWETALDQIRRECDDDEEKLRNYTPGEPHDRPPRLVDVLLRSDVMVYEPLWTLIPSNKAILPVLWQLFPNHPLLLNSSFELTPELRAAGYVAKPIVGRCGSNIKIFDDGEKLLESTEGRFESRDTIYQQYFPLPVIDGRHVQMCTFSAAGTYAGSCVRVDGSMVINERSDVIALRVVDDEEVLEGPS